MKLAKVVGTVVLSQCIESFRGQTLHIIQDVDEELVQRHIDSVRELKKIRNQAKAGRALEELQRAYETGERNVLECEMECCQAYCTTAEMSGVKRMARDQPYDPRGVLEYPFA